MSPATDRSSPTRSARAAPTRPRSAIYSVKTGRHSKTNFPRRIYYSVELHARRQRPLLRPQRSSKGTLLYQHVFGTRDCRRQAHLRPRIPWRATRPHRSLLRPKSLTTPTTSSSPSSAASLPSASTSVFRDLTKPDSPFDVLVWGLDSRFSAIYAKGAWYVRPTTSSPNGRILRADPGIMPDAWKTIVPEGKT